MPWNTLLSIPSHIKKVNKEVTESILEKNLLFHNDFIDTIDKLDKLELAETNFEHVKIPEQKIFATYSSFTKHLSY
jgi:hypothetical protein